MTVVLGCGWTTPLKTVLLRMGESSQRSGVKIQRRGNFIVISGYIIAFQEFKFLFQSFFLLVYSLMSKLLGGGPEDRIRTLLVIWVAVVDWKNRKVRDVLLDGISITPLYKPLESKTIPISRGWWSKHHMPRKGLYREHLFLRTHISGSLGKVGWMYVPRWKKSETNLQTNLLQWLPAGHPSRHPKCSKEFQHIEEILGSLLGCEEVSKWFVSGLYPKHTPRIYK